MTSGSLQGHVPRPRTTWTQTSNSENEREELALFCLSGENTEPWEIRANSFFDVFYASQSYRHFIYIPQRTTGFLQLFGGRQFYDYYPQYSEAETEARAPDLRDHPMIPGQDSLVLNMEPDPGAAKRNLKVNPTPGGQHPLIHQEVEGRGV